MAIDKDFTDCVGIELQDVDLSGLLKLLAALAFALPKIASPDFIPKLPNLPGAAIELFLAGLPSDFPNFHIPDFGGIDFNGGIDLGADIFLPDGMIKLILAFINIAIGLPELFFDLGPPPTPKIPTPNAVLNFIVDKLNLPKIPDLSADIQVRIGGCLAKAILGLIPIPKG